MKYLINVVWKYFQYAGYDKTETALTTDTQFNNIVDAIDVLSEALDLDNQTDIVTGLCQIIYEAIILVIFLGFQKTFASHFTAYNKSRLTWFREGYFLNEDGNVIKSRQSDKPKYKNLT